MRGSQILFAPRTKKENHILSHRKNFVPGLLALQHWGIWDEEKKGTQNLGSPRSLARPRRKILRFDSPASDKVSSCGLCYMSIFPLLANRAHTFSTLNNRLLFFLREIVQISWRENGRKYLTRFFLPWWWKKESLGVAHGNICRLHFLLAFFGEKWKRTFMKHRLFLP